MTDNAAERDQLGRCSHVCLALLLGTSRNPLRDPIAALRGARNPHVPACTLRFLRSVRLALEPRRGFLEVPVCRMHATSALVESAQRDVHPRLEASLRRHFDSEWRQPVHAPSARAFQLLHTILQGDARPLVLDSGCGTGDSTLQLAALFPQHRVIGIDQSAARLQRHAPQGIARIDNAILLRAELASFWRLFVAAGWHAQRHFLLYPNPWPKPAQLARRWHGHPVFPMLMKTADHFELRSNWQVYAAEFALALGHAGFAGVAAEVYDCAAPLTPFERKYRDSGHVLWRVATQQA